MGPRTIAHLKTTRDAALASTEDLLEEFDAADTTLQASTVRHQVEDHLRSAEAAQRRLDVFGGGH
jgi:hypothetical protein